MPTRPPARNRLTLLPRSPTAPLAPYGRDFLGARFWPMRVPGFRPPSAVYRTCRIEGVARTYIYTLISMLILTRPTSRPVFRNDSACIPTSGGESQAGESGIVLGSFSWSLGIACRTELTWQVHVIA
jgi:hypothetical protein